MVTPSDSPNSYYARVRRLARPFRKRLVVPARRATWFLRPPPEVLLIGAMKAGTTSFAAALDRHPQVQMASRKEVSYFDMHFDKGQHWYRSHFAMRCPTASFPLAFEATPYYRFFPDVARRAAALNPRMKLIVLLRDPTERAYSHYQHMKRTGKEPLAFLAAIEAETQRLAGEPERIASGRPAPAEFGRGGALKNHSYLARGQYAVQLQDWLRHFDRSQMMVLKAEKVFEDAAPALRRAATFLGIEPFRSSNFDRLNRGMATQLEPSVKAAVAGHFTESSAWIEREFGFSWSDDYSAG